MATEHGETRAPTFIDEVKLDDIELRPMKGKASFISQTIYARVGISLPDAIAASGHLGRRYRLTLEPVEE